MKVLVVCTGNTCRSPMAQAILERLGRERDVEVRSAGTGAWEEAPASSAALRTVERHGLSLGEHRSRPLAPDLLDWADHVLVMERAHKRVVERMGAAEKVTLLSEYGGDGEDIADPLGEAEERYEDVFAALSWYLESFLETELRAEQRPK